MVLEGTANDATQSGAAGEYEFDDLAPGDWTVRARSLGRAAGVSALDAAWVLQAIVGMRQLSPTQTMACDVTGNGSLSSLDAARILQRVVGLLPTLPVVQACGSDLLVIPAADAPGAVPPAINAGACEPASLRFAPLAASVDGADFDAAFFGDCTLNGGGGAAAAQSVALRTPAGARLGTARRSRRRYLQVPLQVTGVGSFTALEAIVEYDPKELRLYGVRKSGVARRALAAHRLSAPGTVRAVLAAPAPLDPGDGPPLILTFERLHPRGRGVALAGARVDDRPARVTAEDPSDLLSRIARGRGSR
jgi:hypothetical protein